MPAGDVTTSDGPTTGSAVAARSGEGFTAIPKLAADAETPGAFVRASLHAVREHFASPIVSTVVRLNAQSLNDEAVDAERDPDAWRPAIEPLLLAAHANGQTIARLYQSSAADELVAAAACPLPPGAAEMSGALAVCASANSDADLPSLLAELRGLAALITHLAGVVGRQADGPSESGADAATSAVARANDYASTTQLAFAITNSLRSRFDCQQVAMGFVRGPGVKLASISGMDDIKSRSPGTVRIRQAMEECLDTRRPIFYQIEDGWDEAASVDIKHRLHKQWHETTGGAAVVSLPLIVGDRCLAIVSLRRAANRPFSQAEITKLESLLTPFAPAFVVVERASRGVLRVARDRLAESISWLVSPRSLGRKLMLGVLLAGVVWFIFGTLPHNVATRATVVASNVAHVVAPFEAPIAEAFVREGDSVSAGDALCRFDTERFELRRNELIAEGAVLETELEHALDAGDVRDAALADARLNVVSARLTQIESRIARAVLRAPRDGVIMRGDLTGRVGQVLPQGEPLFEIAEADDLQLELRVPEASIDHVTTDQQATFAWTARPESPVTLAIERISPTAEPIDKRNAFRVRATCTDETPAWLRAGMEGHADIHAGDRSAWWVVLHRAIDAARMELWL